MRKLIIHTVVNTTDLYLYILVHSSNSCIRMQLIYRLQILLTYKIKTIIIPLYIYWHSTNFFIFRCISHTVHDHADPWRDSVVSHRTGNWTENATRLAGCLEHYTSMVRRYWHFLLHCYVICRLVLQRHYNLVLLLSV